MATKQKSQFVKWMGPILDALRDLKGSGSPKDVTDWIIKNRHVTEEQLSEKLPSGAPRFNNQVYWGRQYLAWEGYIDSTLKGIWKLSRAGEHVHLTEDQSHAIFLKWVKIHTEKRKAKGAPASAPQTSLDEVISEDNPVIEQNYRDQVLDRLRSMSFSNFEKFSLLLLRENDFEDLKLTGGSKDAGIDGMGILRINPFVSFRVLFQCKRYAADSKITRGQIADFRNSMIGRADKGIFITTSYFTHDAEVEAYRDGAPPIELVNADKLVDMMEHSEFGLEPVKTYKIDERFFSEYEG